MELSDIENSDEDEDEVGDGDDDELEGMSHSTVTVLYAEIAVQQQSSIVSSVCGSTVVVGLGAIAPRRANLRRLVMVYTTLTMLGALVVCSSSFVYRC